MSPYSIYFMYLADKLIAVALTISTIAIGAIVITTLESCILSPICNPRDEHHLNTVKKIRNISLIALFISTLFAVFIPSSKAIANMCNYNDVESSK